MHRRLALLVFLVALPRAASAQVVRPLAVTPRDTMVAIAVAPDTTSTSIIRTDDTRRPRPGDWVIAGAASGVTVGMIWGLHEMIWASRDGDASFIPMLPVAAGAVVGMVVGAATGALAFAIMHP